MRRFIYSLSLCACIVSCKNDKALEQKIAKIPVNVVIERFDKVFDEATPSTLSQLKDTYPFLFSERYDDAFWMSKIEDTLQQHLRRETNTMLSNFTAQEQEIKKLFQHLKYYFPEFKTPRLITVTSDVDYRNKVFVTDTIVLISADTYLGSDHKFYEGISKYIAQNMSKEQVVVDLANAYAERYTLQTKHSTLLDEMIYFGKLLYFKDAVIPFKTNAEKIGYTPEQLNWAVANESEIWRYFISKNYLFGTDPKLINRFIANAPFSKFYLQHIDNESPGRIGQFIGWQIVKTYMENNPEITLKQLLNQPTETIFNASNYKPKSE